VGDGEEIGSDVLLGVGADVLVRVGKVVEVAVAGGVAVDAAAGVAERVVRASGACDGKTLPVGITASGTMARPTAKLPKATSAKSGRAVAAISRRKRRADCRDRAFIMHSQAANPPSGDAMSNLDATLRW
jgi:hypothetical protein